MNKQIFQQPSRPRTHHGYEIFVKFLIIVSLLLLSGCSSIGPLNTALPRQIHEIRSSANDLNSGRISIFLNLKSPRAKHGIIIQINKIEILGDTTWLPIAQELQEIVAEKIGDRQIFMGRGQLPTGNYRRLRFTLTQQASALRDDGKRIMVNVESPTVEINLPSAVDLQQDDSQTIFINWDEANSLPTPGLVQPILTVSPNHMQMSNDLAYAACPSINTIYVIRTDKNWVCDSFGIPGQAAWINAYTQQSDKRLYILSPSRSEIMVLGLPDNNIVKSFPIPMASNPTHMTISPDNQWAYIIDNQEDYLLKMNLNSGELENRIQLSFQPKFIALVQDHNLLAIGSSHSQSVTLLNKTTLDTVGEIQTSGKPEGMLSWNDMLYITEGASNSVTVYDLNRRTIQSRLNVGFYPHQLLQNDNQIYVSNRDSKSISIIQPGQLGIGQEIILNGRPLEMTVDLNNRRLYVGNKNIGGLTVIDTTSKQINGQILFGAVPAGLSVMQ